MHAEHLHDTSRTEIFFSQIQESASLFLHLSLIYMADDVSEVIFILKQCSSRILPVKD